MSKKQLKKGKKVAEETAQDTEEKRYVLSYLCRFDNREFIQPQRLKGKKSKERHYSVPDTLINVVRLQSDYEEQPESYKDFLIHEVAPGKVIKAKIVIEE